MAVSVRVIIGDVDTRLTRVKDGLQDLKKPLRDSGTYMEGSIGRRFRAGAFAPLSPTTIKIHPRRAGGKPLNDTGRLRMSVSSGAIQTVSGNTLRYGTNLVYAPIHNFGGTAGWGSRIPQREFLYFDAQDQLKVREIFEDYIRELHN
jgi:phage gpG-like protein